MIKENQIWLWFVTEGVMMVFNRPVLYFLLLPGHSNKPLFSERKKMNMLILLISFVKLSFCNLLQHQCYQGIFQSLWQSKVYKPYIFTGAQIIYYWLSSLWECCSQYASAYLIPALIVALGFLLSFPLVV